MTHNGSRDAVLSHVLDGADRVGVFVPGTDVGLSVPAAVSAQGVTVVNLPAGRRVVAGFSMKLTLDQWELAYLLVEFTLTPCPEAAGAVGAEGTTSIGALLVGNVRSTSIQRTLAEAAIGISGRDVVLHRGTMTVFDDPALTDLEVVGLLWLFSRLTWGDRDVLIAERFGCSKHAAAQRLLRARRAGAVPPAERQGGRW